MSTQIKYAGDNDRKLYDTYDVTKMLVLLLIHSKWGIWPCNKLWMGLKAKVDEKQIKTPEQTRKTFTNYLIHKVLNGLLIIRTYRNKNEIHNDFVCFNNEIKLELWHWNY